MKQLLHPTNYEKYELLALFPVSFFLICYAFYIIVIGRHVSDFYRLSFFISFITYSVIVMFALVMRKIESMRIEAGKNGFTASINDEGEKTDG